MARPTITAALEKVRDDPDARLAAVFATTFAFSLGFVLGFTIGQRESEPPLPEREQLDGAPTAR